MVKDNIVGKNIRDRRIELNMTQTKLAEIMGYKDKSAISRIENGKNDISQTLVRRFAKALGTTPASLMGWETVNDKIVSEYPSGKALMSNKLSETETGKEILKNNALAEIYDYLDGVLPTFEEMDYIKAIRRLNEYDKRIVEMIFERSKEEGEHH